MDFIYDWGDEADQLSFEDSDRFEEDSLCSWVSEAESVCNNNWRGWKKNSNGAGSGGAIPATVLPSSSSSSTVTEGDYNLCSHSQILTLQVEVKIEVRALFMDLLKMLIKYTVYEKTRKEKDAKTLLISLIALC